jgi:hypothetical protein
MDPIGAVTTSAIVWSTPQYFDNLSDL